MANAQSTKWVIRDTFTGLQSKKDPSKVTPGSVVAGQNVTFPEMDRISVRELGYETYPSESVANADTTKVHSIHTFRRRDGENILMRAYGGKLQAYDKVAETWATVSSGYTPGVRFGFADQNINTDQTSFTYFGNGRQNYSRWSGATTQLTVPLVPTSTTVGVVGTAGFATSGSIVIGGTRKAYSALTSTVITLVGTAGTTVAAGATIMQGIQQYPNNPKGNIFLANSNRMFVAGSSTVASAVYFSKYGDSTNFVNASLVTDTTADSAGIFNLAEGGGGVSGMALDENATYFLKRGLIYKATLTDALYTLTPLKPFDGKGQITGSVGEPFSAENGTVFVTPDKKVYHLTRLPQVDYPQLVPISDPIKNTVESLYFENYRGISFQDNAYIACSSTENGENDRVLVYDLVNKVWQSPITGWNVTDWAIYDNGDGLGDQLFFASNNSLNVFKVNTTPIDGEFDVSAIAIMNQETFGAPAERKFIDNFFLEGYIGQNTTLNISLLFDDNGFTQQLSGSISGTESDFIFDTDSLNQFGLNPFGLELLGGSSDLEGLSKFRLYLKNTLRTIPFYSIQLQLSSESSNAQWRVINVGYKVGIYEQDESRKLYKAFN